VFVLLYPFIKMECPMDAEPYRSEEGAINQNESGGEDWEHEYIPDPVQQIIQSYDTAFMKKETADYSAITTWGVFHHPLQIVRSTCLILLDAIKGRLRVS
jgi:hypothetical protein